MWEMIVLDIGERLITSRGSCTFNPNNKAEIRTLATESEIDRKGNMELVEYKILARAWSQV